MCVIVCFRCVYRSDSQQLVSELRVLEEVSVLDIRVCSVVAVLSDLPHQKLISINRIKGVSVL